MWAEACRLLDRAERVRHAFFQPPDTTRGGSWEPPIDLYETAEAWWVVAALPGVSPDDMRFTLEGDILHLEGERTLPRALAQGSIRRMEIPHGRFERVVRFARAPLAVTHAEARDGCLVIALRKPGR